MKNFFNWFDSSEINKSKPWLILGKGPSFSKIKECDLNNYNIISLNHVVRELKVNVAHIIDFDVVVDCANEILNNSQYLVMPWFPHFKNKVGTKNLEDLV